MDFRLHDGSVLSFSTPARWELVSQPVDGPGIESVVLSPPTDGFRSNVVVTTSQVGDLSLSQWESGTDAFLAETTRLFVLIDRSAATHPLYPWSERIATFVTEEDVSVTMNQWSMIHDGLGLTLSFTTATEDYPDMLEVRDRLRRSVDWKRPR